MSELDYDPNYDVGTTGALGALNASVILPMGGHASCGFQIAVGTLIGTLVPECSVDGGTTWASGSFYDTANASVTSSIVFGSANTLKVVSILAIGGSTTVRVRVSAYTSGTANAVLSGSQITAAAGAVTAAAFGTVTNTYITPANNVATLLLAANSSRKYAAISNPSGSQLNIQLGTGTGLSTTTGFVIASKVIYEFKGDNLWTGAIFGFMAGGASLTVVEGTP